ncbi:MAG: DUF1802 family protein [Nostocaceae cyanobacterium]|nr:DUF1802 family protein [Nostocaceae cyanobacterium]
MNQKVSISTALCLPVSDIEALIQGQTIAALPRMFIHPGQQFALYPSNSLPIPLAIEQYYRSNYLPIAQTNLNRTSLEKVSIQGWAKCELCQIIDNTTTLDTLSEITIWTPEALQKILQQQQHIFLAYLRVYQLPQPQKVTVNHHINDKIGKFVSLPLTATNSTPILSDRTFAQRKQQLENLQPPLHPELETLQILLATLTHPAAKQLSDEIKLFLGWNSHNSTQPIDSDLAWIKKIAEVGNSSDGHKFEKLVRKALLKLGFTGSGLNPEITAGAGEIDFYCEYPYPIVGECKATKSEKVPDSTPAQLLKIGMNHLGKSQYDNSIKLIVAAGKLNFYAKRTARENYMNVISPETLQKLVELQAKYQGSINLLELKQCLQQEPFGLADNKINSYIQKIYQNIKLRSHIIQTLKKHLEIAKCEKAGVEALHAAFIHSNPPQMIDSKQLREILIELSSPLTGYIGRIKGEDWRRDYFYFLRDLPIT